MIHTHAILFRFLFVSAWLSFPAFALHAHGETEQSGQSIELATVSGSDSAHHVITEAGTYYLSSDLEVSKRNGIEIESPGVTLDLNEFEVRRASNSGGHGILIAHTADRCTVKNGSVSGFAYGVRAFSAEGRYLRLEASESVYVGIVAGKRWFLDRCEAHDNGETGIRVGDGSTIMARPEKPRDDSGSERSAREEPVWGGRQWRL